MGVTAENSKPKRIRNWWSSHEPFVAPAGYASSFQIGWETPPVCGRCGVVIQPGDRVIWTGKLPPSEARQLCHVECAEEGMTQ